MDEVENKYRPFNEARKFVRRLRLRSEVEWNRYIKNLHRKSYEKPSDIPSNPDIIYKNIGWIDYSDWLGIEYLDYETARKYIRHFEIKSKEEWDNSYFEFMPNNLPIPLKAEEYYTLKGWVDWDEWLMVNEPLKSRNQYKWNNWILSEQSNSRSHEISLKKSLVFKNFNKSREYVKGLCLSSVLEWEQYIAGVLIDKGIKPKDIPAQPDEIYKHKGWKGWFHWLGNEIISFEEARKFARRLNFQNKSEWFDYTLGTNRFNLPINYDIPDDPSLFYKNNGWISWEDWLGIRVKIRKNIVEFEMARELSRSLGIKNSIEWNQNLRLLKRNEPLKYKDIPVRPDITYKYSGWKGWNDWLGVEPIEKWRNFIEARKFARSLNLRGKEDWMDYVRDRIKIPIPLPSDIPKDPSQRYKNKGWISWTDWVQAQTLNYDDAKNIVKELKIKNSSQWARNRKGEYVDMKPLPVNIPKTPNTAYKNNGWKGWSDWLGDNYIPQNSKKHFRSFEEAKKFVHSLGIKTSSEWSLYAKGECKDLIPLPEDIPHNPKGAYLNQGWIDWKDWLGNSYEGRAEKKYRNFEDAREFARKLKLKNSVEWAKYVQRKLTDREPLPEDIPKNPKTTYKKMEWISWSDWLGESYSINEKS